MCGVMLLSIHRRLKLFLLIPHYFISDLGGPVIVPYDKTRACQTPIGEEFKHLVFQLKQPP